MTVTIEWPMRLKNPLNGSREHWAVKAKRAKAERNATTLMLKAHDSGTFVSGVTHALGGGASLWRLNGRLAVRLVRIYAGRSQAMDDDGLAAAFKHVRDAVAAYFGVDDADPRIRFVCAQARGPVNLVRIDFAVEDDMQTRVTMAADAARARIDAELRRLADDDVAEVLGEVTP